MPKRKRRPSHTPPRAPRSLTRELVEADSLIQRKRWPEARDLLESLARRHARDDSVLKLLVNVYYDLQDIGGYQSACERLIKLTPDDPDATVGLAGAYMTNIHPVSALRTFRRFLDRWPNHERAGEARATVAELEARLGDLLGDLGLSGEDALELASLHEEVQSLSEQGSYREARRVAEQLLCRRPDFVPALNNLSQVDALEGRLSQAIAAALRVLDLEPDNIHALSNLTRYLCLSGQIDEAKQWAERLKAVESERVDVWTKKAEALSYLADDQGVLDAFHGADRAGCLEPPLGDPLLYHLAAVAALRLGREEEARRLWRDGLRLAPGLDDAQANLADLRKPVGERHAPWPFVFANWVPRQAIHDLVGLVGSTAARRDDRAVGQATRRYLHRHPEVAAIVPLLLDRGDPEGREFALRLALMAKTPELLDALRDFALSQRGPDAMRMEAAQAAADARLLAAGPARLWMDGEWREVLLMGFEIHGEATTGHKPPVEEWAAEAFSALHGGDSERVRGLLEQALELEPGSPDLLYNLAMAHDLIGDARESEAIVRQLHQRHPDYLFGRVAMSRLYVRERKLKEARAVLEPVLSRRRLHFSEFGAFCGAQIELARAEGNLETVRSWLGLWESADPDNPALAEWRRRLEPSGWRSLLSRRERRSRGNEP